MTDDVITSIFFCGDPHGQLHHIVTAVLERRPAAIILLGDIMAKQPLEIELAPILNLTQIWWIHGNHDTDTEKHYDNLFGSQLADRNLHGRVVEIDGLRIAGLGGVFRNKIWDNQSINTPDDYLAMCGKGNRWRGGMAMKHRSTIFRSEVETLAQQWADILVTHEGPGVHRMGKQVISGLAKSMNVRAAFHGHLHEDIQYADGTWRGVRDRGIFFFEVKRSRIC